MKNIIIPSTGPRPICLLGFKPNQLNREIFIEHINRGMQDFLNLKYVTKKTFELNTFFPIGERLLYVPYMPKSRKFVKVQVEQKWLLEKPEYKIDPLYAMYDLLVFEGIVYIRFLLNKGIQNMTMDITEGLANYLSQFGSTYLIYHLRMPGTGTNNDTEYFRETKNKRITEEQLKKPGAQKDVIRFMLDRYSLDLEKIIETIDLGIEIQCAPYDLREYNEKLCFLENAKNSDIAKVQFDSEDDTIGKEIAEEITSVKALITSTNEMVQKYSNIDLMTQYFKLPVNALPKRGGKL